jgi:hypothetical protein
LPLGEHDLRREACEAVASLGMDSVGLPKDPQDPQDPTGTAGIVFGLDGEPHGTVNRDTAYDTPA